MKLFGTDGMRGVAGKYPLDKKTIECLARAAAAVLKKKTHERVVLMGRDTRQSGPGIADILKKSFTASGIDVWDAGVIPTPGVAYLAKNYPVMAGVVISASHNPYKDNGIKFFSHQGTKLPDSIESVIEKILLQTLAEQVEKKAVKPGKSKDLSSLALYFENYLKSSFQQKAGLAGMRIVLDCANGATFSIAPSLFKSLGAEVFVMNAKPNGKNINLGSGSLHPEKLAAEVKKRKADIGLAFDGDGDRVMFVDERGNVRDGDFILAIMAVYLKSKGLLKGNTLVTTVMANLGLIRAMEKEKIKVLTTAVGDRYVYEGMVKSGAIIGGEQSGHLIFKEMLPTGDGIQSALQILAVLVSTGKKLSVLSEVMKKYPQILINTYVAAKVPLEKLPKASKLIKAAQKELGNDGRVLVRYSGTENLLRVMIEGKDKAVIDKMAKDISDIAKVEIEEVR